MSWTDRVVEFPNRVKLTSVPAQDGVYDIEPKEGQVYIDGTLLNAENFTNETMNLISGVTSDKWETSRTYKKNEYCIYDNILWKCKVQNSGNTPVEGTYWTSVNVGNELTTSVKKDYIAISAPNQEQFFANLSTTLNDRLELGDAMMMWGEWTGNQYYSAYAIKLVSGHLNVTLAFGPDLFTMQYVPGVARIVNRCTMTRIYG